MVKPTDRRISLQPVFEPFDLVDSESMMQPLPTNGYHPESSDDEANLFAGLHCEPTEAAGSDSEPSDSEPSDSEPSDSEPSDSEPSGSPANGAAINGAAINGAAIDGGATGVPAMTTVFAAMNGGTNGTANGNGTVNGADHGAANNGTANGAVNHAENRIAEEFDGDRDLADLASAKASFSAESTSTSNNDLTPAASDDLTPAASDDLAIGQNGDSLLIADQLLLGESEISGEAPHAADAERFHASPVDAAPFDAAPVDAAPLGEARFDVPPPVDDQAIQPAEIILPPAEPFPQEPLGDASEIATTAREPHPAAGSMFMPYLVTEIRELRNRSPRRRSWWRRLFG